MIGLVIYLSEVSSHVLRETLPVNSSLSSSYKNNVSSACFEVNESRTQCVVNTSIYGAKELAAPANRSVDYTGLSAHKS